MIRDPSDGSVKKPNQGYLEPEAVNLEALRAKHGPNWGMKSLDKPPRIPKPAPTAEELKQHYSKFALGFQPKEQG